VHAITFVIPAFYAQITYRHQVLGRLKVPEDTLCQVTEYDPARELVVVLETLSQFVRDAVLLCH